MFLHWRGGMVPCHNLTGGFSFMTNDPKKSEQEVPTWEEDPERFLQNLPNDPVWVNSQRQRKELREKYDLPDEPKLEDFPDYDSWSVAWDANRETFDEVTGCGKRSDEISKLYWSGDFEDGLGTERDFMTVADNLNYTFGKCSLDDVIAEWRKQNAH